MFEFLLSYFGNKQRLFNYFLPIPYRFTEDYQSIGGQFENIWRVNKNFLMFGSMTFLLTLINWGGIILLMLSPTFKLIVASYIYICLVWYLIFMRPKFVSRDQRGCLNKSVRICLGENLLPDSWPPPNFLELGRKSMKVESTQTSAYIPPLEATICIFPFHMFNVWCHSIG